MTAFYIVSGMLVLAALGTWWLALPLGIADDSMSEVPIALPEPQLDTTHGPAVVTVEYHVAAGSEDAFLAASGGLRRARRRTGAVHWHLHRDIAEPTHFQETFIVGSWEDHEHQHERLTGRDRAAVDDIDRLLAPDRPRHARHFVGVRPPRRHRFD
jgi:hypothetical protein